MHSHTHLPGSPPHCSPDIKTTLHVLRLPYPCPPAPVTHTLGTHHPWYNAVDLDAYPRCGVNSIPIAKWLNRVFISLNSTYFLIAEFNKEMPTLLDYVNLLHFLNYFKTYPNLVRCKHCLVLKTEFVYKCLL